MGKTVAQMWHVAAPHVEYDLWPPGKECRGKVMAGWELEREWHCRSPKSVKVLVKPSVKTEVKTEVKT